MRLKTNLSKGNKFVPSKIFSPELVSLLTDPSIEIYSHHSGINLPGVTPETLMGTIAAVEAALANDPNRSGKPVTLEEALPLIQTLLHSQAGT